MAFVALKGVSKKTWQLFKSESARHGLNMGDFFKKILEEHLQNSHASWDDILRGRALLSEAEAKELKKSAKKFRKGFSFR